MPAKDVKDCRGRVGYGSSTRSEFQPTVMGLASVSHPLEHGAAIAADPLGF